MLRSSSKMITRARSVRKLGKVPFKFKFDLLIETLEKIAASGDIVVVWERNSSKKVEATRAVRIDRATRKASFNNEKISAEMTLFKGKPTDKKFQDKVVKLAVRAGNADGKTLTKIHLNLADYAEVPSGSKRVSASLSNGGVLIATIQCQFLSMGKASINGPPSKGSRTENTSEGSTDEEELLDDLEQDATSFSSNTDTEKSFRSRLKIINVSSRKSTQRHERRSGIEENHENWNGNATLDKLRKENVRLRKMLDEAEKGGEAKLIAECDTMRSEIGEMKTNLCKEVEYADVLKELTEAKMALALLHMDKDIMELKLRKERKRVDNGRGHSRPIQGRYSRG